VISKARPLQYGNLVENLDLMVLRTLRDWRGAGRRALLVTVVRTWGSSPRPVGSIMAIAQDGQVVGSVSGGCIEDDLIQDYCVHGRFATLAEGQAPVLLTYGVTADEAHRFGLPCGGTLELLVEYNPDAGLLAELVHALESGRLLRRCVSLRDGSVVLGPGDVPEELSLTPAEMANTFGPAYRMLLIGAGELTGYLATMATFAGFDVTVCDPRSEYGSNWQVAGVRFTTEMPDDVVTAFRADSRSCVIALTHDPKLDDLALLEAIGSDAFYVGAIGSRRNSAARRARLEKYFDLAPAAVARLRGPVGLYIGSKTPAEIAVIIMAEILAVKNGVDVPLEMAVAHAKAQ